MKAWMRKLVIACAVASVVLAVLAASASADRPIKQIRPQYVEWGDPDYPHAKQRSSVSSGTLCDSENGSAPAGGGLVNIGAPFLRLRYGGCDASMGSCSRNVRQASRESECSRRQVERNCY